MSASPAAPVSEPEYEHSTAVDRKTEFKALKVSDIIRPPETQMRARGLTAEVVERYSAADKAGDRLPAVTVFGPNEHGLYYLSRGHHRMAGFDANGRTKVNCEIHPGGLREAVLDAAGSNVTHGLPRTADDVRKAVLTLLKDSEYAKWPADRLAGVVRCRKAVILEIKQAEKERLAALKGEEAPKPKRRGPGRPAKDSSRGTTADNGRAERSMPSAKAAAKDDYGRALPDNLRDVFGYVAYGKALAKGLKQPAEEVAAFRKTPAGKLINESNIVAALKSACESVEQFLPAAVCPTCDGLGKLENGKAADCETFDARGWLPPKVVNDLPNAVRKKVLAGGE